MSTASAVVPAGYKLTEIGVIPEDWIIRQLNEITMMMTNGFVGTVKRHYTDDGSQDWGMGNSLPWKMHSNTQYRMIVKIDVFDITAGIVHAWPYGMCLSSYFCRATKSC